MRKANLTKFRHKNTTDIRYVLPIGTDHSIEEKIRWAKSLYEDCGGTLLSDSGLVRRLEEYRRAAQETWDVMRQIGVTAECTECAVNDGGSCCGAGIENRFDTALLLINLLLGASLPDRRQEPGGCWFLGEQGCTIPARHVICINYICRRLEQKIPPQGLKMLHGKIAREADVAFVAEEYLKSLFSRGIYGKQTSNIHG